MVKILSLKPLKDPVDIRVRRDPAGVQFLIDQLRGHIHRRFRQKHMTAWHRRKRSQDLADPFRQDSPPQDAVRYIRPQLYPPLHQFLICKLQSEHPVHPV